MSREDPRLAIRSLTARISTIRSAQDMPLRGTSAEDVERQFDMLRRGFRSYCQEVAEGAETLPRGINGILGDNHYKQVAKEMSVTVNAAMVIAKDFYDRNPSIDDVEYLKLSEFVESLIDIQRSQFYHIENKDHILEFLSQLAPRGRLDQFEQALNADGHDGAAIRKLAEKLFPELKHDAAGFSASPYGLALPTEAPETYQGLRGPETPPEFVKRVYGPWLGQGLTRADIRKLDPKLSVAITNWLSRPGNEWPVDVDLPTKSEQTTRWVERIKQEGVAAAIEGLPATEALKVANRFHGAVSRRNK